MRVIGGEYFYCSGKANHHICDGIPGKPDISEIEDAVFSELEKKFSEIRNLTIGTGKTKSSPKANKLKMQLETLNTQIDNLVDKIAETSAAIGKVLEEKLEKLISEREEVETALDKLTEKKSTLAYEEIIPLIDDFHSLPINVRREIARQFIVKVLLWEDKIEIEWKF